MEFLSALRVPREVNDHVRNLVFCLDSDILIVCLIISSTRECPGNSTLARCGPGIGDVPTPEEIEGLHRPDPGWGVSILPPRRSEPIPRFEIPTDPERDLKVLTCAADHAGDRLSPRLPKKNQRT